MKPFLSVAVLALLAACNQADDEPLRVSAMVAFPPKDSVRFSLPAASHRCEGSRAILLEAVSPQGYGVLVRLRFADSLTSGPYRLVLPSDTGATHAASVVLRYLVRDTPHGMALDSGEVKVQRAARSIGASIKGAGLENAIRVPATIEYADVPLPTDSVSCRFEP